MRPKKRTGRMPCASSLIPSGIKFINYRFFGHNVSTTNARKPIKGSKDARIFT